MSASITHSRFWTSNSSGRVYSAMLGNRDVEDGVFPERKKILLAVRAWLNPPMQYTRAPIRSFSTFVDGGNFRSEFRSPSAMIPSQSRRKRPKSEPGSTLQILPPLGPLPLPLLLPGFSTARQSGATGVTCWKLQQPRLSQP